MKVALLLVTLFAYVFAQQLSEAEYRDAFSQWMTQYEKVYASYFLQQTRFEIFRSNLDFINSHDAEAKGYTVALNEFADQTSEEFASWALRMNITVEVDPTVIEQPLLGLPTSVDWRSKGAVTPVKNQGQCGSCWAFSATGSVEAAHFQKTGKLVSLSEQNLVDCSVPQGNHGCNGGLMNYAFKYIISNKGIDTEASYPYTASGPNTCKFNPATIGATISSYKDVRSGSESDLQAHVAAAPTSVAIDAGQQTFQFYSSGVYYEPACSSTRLNHGVLAVGYGEESGKEYWMVKNSWGTGWGAQGYIKMARNRNNNCGIATASSRAIV